MERVISEVNAIELFETHFSDARGKIVATIEGDNINDQTERLKHIQNIPFVFSASLSYSYCEDELRDSLDKIRQ